MKEEWKPIKGWKYYEVSTFGKVKSIMFVNNICKKKRDKILKTVISKKQREYVSLKQDGYRKNCTVHRLVAEAFIPNPNNYPQINHIDGNPTNNIVSNLEWCTGSHNAKHAYINDLTKLKSYNESKKKSIIRSDGKVYDCAYSAASELKCSVCSIRDCLKGRINTCKGYKFKYLDSQAKY